MTNDEGMTKFKYTLRKYALLWTSSFELRHSNGPQDRGSHKPINSLTYFTGGLPYEIT